MIYKDLDQLSQVLPSDGRIMGLDVGTRRIGVAVSDISRMIATPKETIGRKGNKHDLPILQKLAKENNVKAIIIGMPINMDGSENEMCQFMYRFADNLDSLLGDAPIAFFDERLTSFEAEDLLNEKIEVRNNKKKQLVDQIAAAIILQSFLNSLKL